MSIPRPFVEGMAKSLFFFAGVYKGQEGRTILPDRLWTIQYVTMCTKRAYRFFAVSCLYGKGDSIHNL